MSRSPLGIVLAAGLGTRMRSQTPKVMHTAAGRPLLAWILGTLAEVGARPVVVLSKESEPARALLNGEATFAMQDPPRGTGDAVRVALESVKDARGEALIVYGDTPLVRAETLRALIALRTERSAVLAILSGEVGADNAYGRIVRNASGDVARIVEARLATTTEKALAESNLGAYAADLEWLRGAVTRLRANETGEIFLTDLVALAVGDGRRVAAHLVADLYQRIRERHMLAGVTFHDPASSFVGADVELAPDVVIERGSLLEGKTRVGSGTRIGPYSVLRDTTVGENCKAEMSVLEGATLEDDCRIGPFGHLRPGAYLERGVEMGNYGEVKAARLGAGTKMHHFGYVGDASVGKRVNIGAGTITMNYTAKRTKERTEIGDDAFIGSDSLLRAPVRVGNRSITGGGSVVTKDVPDDTVAVGVPARAIKKNQPKQKA
ncbi:MAG: UDP-N-acetylglucosamine diphosphorylase/glucosamine-1-phosphate N-acetyltransferase [Chloroflexi bacterium]|nr:MAG: UDP-N-acetylglucosamine diphosphorylase/glucosamine-1-phosphate N-acetyltransferase [Chloroflexota bacterium]